jgi:hypothetical protein
VFKLNSFDVLSVSFSKVKFLVSLNPAVSFPTNVSSSNICAVPLWSTVSFTFSILLSVKFSTTYVYVTVCPAFI